MEGKTGSLYKKLAAVTRDVGYVPKNGRNEFHKYDYVTEADLVDAIRGKLAEHGVAYLFSVDDVEIRETQTGPDGKPTKGGQITTVRVNATFADGDTGECASITGFGTGQDTGDKGLYKAITGAQKYLLMKTFLVPTGDDPEGDEKVDKATGEVTEIKPHGPKAGAKKSDDPQEKEIPAGKYKGRKVGSLTTQEAMEIANGVPANTDWARALQARLDTIAALTKLSPQAVAALEQLDLEVAK